MKKSQKTECGRSMVEMLGTLAIMGLLGITGLYGYTTAMDRHRANELLNEASKRAVVIAAQIASGRKPSTDSSDRFKVSGPDGIKAWEDTDKQFTLSVNGVSKAVCNQMKNAFSGVIKDFKPDPCDDNATVTLTYNNDMSTADLAPSVTSTADGWTGDKPGSDCSDDTKLGGDSGCQVCVDSSYVDSDAKCSSEQTCIAGRCTTPEESTGTGCLKNSDCESVTGCSGSKCFCGYYVLGGIGSANNVDNYGPKAANGTCLVTANYSTPVSVENDGISGVLSTKQMDWFSAKNFCQATEGSMISLNESSCTKDTCSWNKYKNKLSGASWWTKDLENTDDTGIYASPQVDASESEIYFYTLYSEGYALCK